MNNNKKWSNEEIDFLKKNYIKYSNQELSEILKRTKSSVQLKISKLGLKRPDKYFYDKDFFENINTEEKAYWLGFIYADGYVYYSEEKRNYELGIELQIGDINHLRKFNKSINGNLEVKITEKYDKRYEKTYRHCTIRLHDKKLVEDLNKNGVVQNKSYIIKFPNLRNDLIVPFIRGFFDGDGCLQLNKQRQCHRFDFACASIDFVNKLRDILYNNYNINSYITQDKNIYRLNIRGLTNAYLFGKLLYDNSTIYLDRKYNKFYNIVEEYNIKNRIRIK